MRLATRTGLASFVAASITLLAVGALFRGYFAGVLRDRVDAQLEERAETAPILAAVADRLSQSELRTTLEGARVVTGGGTISLGLLPDDPLPAEIVPGWSTARASGDRWRLYTVEVSDVPNSGDRALVQLVSPLGDVDARAMQLRRRVIFVMALTSLAAGLVGYLLGKVATRPLTALRRDTARIEDAEPSTWRVGTRYGSTEVDAVAATLNENLERLADETHRRGAALEAARAFSASATHELRTPLQSALINLDMARSDRIAEPDRAEVLGLANEQLQRMAGALSAVRALADAEFAGPLGFAAHPVEQDGVGIAQQPVGQRQAFQAVDGECDGADVVLDLAPIVANFGQQVFGVLECILDIGLGALDPARLRGFLGHVHADEKFDVGNQLGKSVQLAKRAVGLAEQLQHLRVGDRPAVVDRLRQKAAIFQLGFKLPRLIR